MPTTPAITLCMYDMGLIQIKKKIEFSIMYGMYIYNLYK